MLFHLNMLTYPTRKHGQMYFMSEFNAEAVCQSVAACMKPHVYMCVSVREWALVHGEHCFKGPGLRFRFYGHPTLP